jgi:adenosylmethionine-8-amino-7-oxononanoate aminotransferase
LGDARLDRKGEPAVSPMFVKAESSQVFHRDLDEDYPMLVRGSGVQVLDAAGHSYVDGVGGAMVTGLGAGMPPRVREAMLRQMDELTYVWSGTATSPAHEALATRVVALAPDGFTRARFTSGGTEANEMALRMARSYWTEQGELQRHLIVTGKAYHGASMATFGLTGRAGMQAPYEPYIRPQPSVAPATWRTDPSGAWMLAELDALFAEHGPESVAAVLLEPVSAMSLPGYTPPELFWRGLEERRREHGFLLWFDEVVTAFGRTGSWFAADRIPAAPDIITVAKGLGAGFMPIGGMLVRDHVYQAVAEGSRSFEAGHTGDGAPLACAAAGAVLDELAERGLVELVARRGPGLLEALSAALADVPMVREVRGHGFLLGVSYTDPRDRDSFLDPGLNVAQRIDDEAKGRGLLLRSTQGYGDQTTLAPAFVATGGELEQIVTLVAESVRAVNDQVEKLLAAPAGRP